MARAINTPLEVKLYDALKRISQYEQPERLIKNAERVYGIPGEEALEYAYENVLGEAKRAIKGVRIRRHGGQL
ncbi:hypothetical protein [Rhizorhabdus sp.]|uniref:hypothetical protein n=1 Tax=Rhizorhabdus sp. TaxID=1968843 RepID=UPI0019B93FDC|nr:hypothetical protein [Rhizorhabdus sp.]MBD3762600.1 hypothetical protein [Rhizorhabdus sp.]